jgi:hypothetical protein
MSTLVDSAAASGAAAGIPPEPALWAASCGAENPELRTCARPALSALFGRGLYWLPVFAPMLLFGQVALLGLRPALCERARLSAAETALEERYRADAAQHEIIRANLRARQDPIFLERQRRWLRVARPAR